VRDPLVVTLAVLLLGGLLTHIRFRKPDHLAASHR